MQKFEFTIYIQSRLLISLLLMCPMIFASIFMGMKLNSFIVGFLIFIILSISIFYYTVGYMKVIISEEDVIFQWNKKIFFNYKPIKTIKLKDIKTIVLDEGRILKKIKTSDYVIYINHTKVNSNAQKFVTELRNITKKYNPNIIDSWDEFAEKGYLKFAYKLNTLILVIAICLVLLVIFFKGFKANLLFVLLLFIPQMILYGQQMKDKNK